MLRAVRRTTRLAGARRLSTQPPATPRRNWLPELGLGVLTFGGTLYFLYFDRRAVDHLFAFKDEETKPAPAARKAEAYSEATAGARDQAELLASAKLGELEIDDALVSAVWGSNKDYLLSPQAGSSAPLRTAAAAPWPKDVALRDLAFAEGHAACVDARGDVYQWGAAFTDDRTEPKATLSGKNIVSLQLSSNRVYALSASGSVYMLPAQAAKQDLPAGAPTPASAPWWGTGWMWGEEQAGAGTIDFVKLAPDASLAKNERFTSISAGTDHLLALTSSGRTFAHPISLRANTHGQLGVRSVDVPVTVTNLAQPDADTKTKTADARVQFDLPKAGVDLLLLNSPHNRAPYTPDYDGETKQPKEEVVVDDKNLRFCDRLYEIPALRGVPVAQVVAGGRHSFVRTDTGRVLGWGANEYGQIGLGDRSTLQAIGRPTEVVPVPAIARGTADFKCLDVVAAGDLSMFTVERRDGSAIDRVDVNACGNGQYGGLGNGVYSNAQRTPARVKGISGLMEYDEASSSLQPIVPHSISISPSGHVLCALETHARAGPGGGVAGRDLLSWGFNADSQLGNGKKNTLAVPTNVQVRRAESEGGRYMLRARRAAVVRDMRGEVWKKGVEVEQVAVAGPGCSAVYWRIC